MHRKCSDIPAVVVVTGLEIKAESSSSETETRPVVDSETRLRPLESGLVTKTDFEYYNTGNRF